MVIGGFPLAKLGTLLIRQASKPLANYIIEHAKKSPFLRTYICMPPAQFYNWCEVKTKMWILNLGKPVNVPVLNEAMAIELGANLLGEGIIFSIAAILLIREYYKSSKKEQSKELQRQQEMQNLSTNVQELFLQVQEQHAQIRELLREIYTLQGKKLPEEQREKDKNDSKSPPPPPHLNPAPSEPLKQTPAPKAENTNIKNTNILMNAVSSFENEFLNISRKERECGVITIALNYLYQDVYQVPLTMY